MLSVVTTLLLTFTRIDLHDPAIHGVFAALLTSARYGCSNEEQAAFIIRNASGTTFFLHWRTSGQLNRAEWDGPIPVGTVAIVHTHPNWLPLPSNLDTRLARRTSLPVYVITRTRITRSDGGEPTVVAAGDWSGN